MKTRSQTRAAQPAQNAVLISPSQVQAPFDLSAALLAQRTPVGCLTQLPMEILQQVISLLSIRSLIALAQTASELRSWLLASTDLWENILVTQFHVRYLPKHLFREVVRRYPKRRCHRCDGVVAARTKCHPFLRVKICPDCMETEEYATMTVTRAKAEFRLNDVDIADLSCQTRPNLYNLRGPPMRIYMIRDLRRKSNEKHQAMNTTLEKAAQKARETKRKRQENSDAAQETRREALTQALAEYRLRFLPEGKLCKAYLTDRWRGFGKRWTLEEVVSRLRDIHIINAHIPNFVDLLDSFLWSHGGSMTLEEAEAAAERDALRRFHERQPYWEARGHRCHCGVFIP